MPLNGVMDPTLKALVLITTHSPEWVTSLVSGERNSHPYYLYTRFHYMIFGQSSLTNV